MVAEFGEFVAKKRKIVKKVSVFVKANLRKALPVLSGCDIFYACVGMAW
jgi:hypothetical protein